MKKIDSSFPHRCNDVPKPSGFVPTVLQKLEDGSLSRVPYSPSETVASVDDYSLGSLMEAGVDVTKSSMPFVAASPIDAADSLSDFNFDEDKIFNKPSKSE